MKRIINKLLSLLPPFLLDIAFRSNGEHRFRTALTYQLRRKALRFVRRPDKFKKLCARLHHRGRIMVIREVFYPTTTFSCYFVFEILGLMLFCLSRHQAPMIRLNDPDIRNINWPIFFQQPICSDGEASRQVNDCPLLCSPYKPSFNILTLSQDEVRFWRLFAQTLLKPSAILSAHMSRDFSFIPSPRTGVLLRGTDYIKLRPKGHPRQPDPADIIDWLSENKHFKPLYVATEDKSLFDACVQRFGKDAVYANDRVYLDAAYSSGEYRFVSEITSDALRSSCRDRALQYLSSLWILINSEEVFFALSGGPIFVYLMRPSLNGLYIMDCGFYD